MRFDVACVTDGDVGGRGDSMNTRLALAALILGSTFGSMTLPAVAETANCTSSDAGARQECRTQKRFGYGTRLQRSLNDYGKQASVYVEETGDSNSGAYPKLIVWTDVNNSTIYKLISDARILDGARAVGFRTIQFTDRGEDGHWFFDLTRPGIDPRNVEFVDKRLPWIPR